jgi:hypothetical protein
LRCREIGFRDAETRPRCPEIGFRDPEMRPRHPEIGFRNPEMRPRHPEIGFRDSDASAQSGESVETLQNSRFSKDFFLDGL